MAAVVGSHLRKSPSVERSRHTRRAKEQQCSVGDGVGSEGGVGSVRGGLGDGRMSPHRTVCIQSRSSQSDVCWQWRPRGYPMSGATAKVLEESLHCLRGRDARPSQSTLFA